MITDDHKHAAALIERGRADEASAVVTELLNVNHDDALALFQLGQIHALAGRYGIASVLFRRCIDLKPDRHEAWNNFGMSLESMHKNGLARQAFEKAASLCSRPGYWANLGLTWLHDGDTQRAIKFTDKALALDPKCNAARITGGFARLQVGDWKGGWEGFSAALGGKFRARVDYGLPDWNGEPEAHVIVYGEQGLGDEIMYGSCLPDLIGRVRAVTLDCDERLAKVFARSFPGIAVHGTRRHDKAWLTTDHTHSIAIGELPRLFRPSPDACPGTAYLASDPDLRVMYEALQGHHAIGGQPRIGIAWTGGTRATSSHRREFDPALFAPLAKQASLFSLQYNAPAESDTYFHFHAAVGRGAGFDHTLAFIDSLDAVIGVDTTACHAAGALGKPVITLVHDRCNWIHGAYQGDRSAWYRSMRLFRQREGEPWSNTMQRLMGSDTLSDLLGAL